MTDSDEARLGRRIADLRKQHRYSQTGFAEQVNEASQGAVRLTQNAVSRIELGVRAVSVLEGVYIAKVFDMTVETLVGVPVLGPALAALDVGQHHVCPGCGALVDDMDAHNAWHRQQTEFLARLVGAAAGHLLNVHYDETTGAVVVDDHQED